MNSQKPDSLSSFQQAAQQNESATKTNTVVFGILLIILQIAVGLLYGFFANIPAVDGASSNQFAGSIIPVFLAFGMLFLVIVGFGLIFAYVRRLVWSSIGFGLLIACLTIQWFFLMNAFWTKVDLGGEGTWTQVWESDKTFNIYLTNTGSSATVIGSTQTNGATLTNAIHCALANIIAFSSVLGKAGPLQALLLSMFGTFGFELNRKLILLLGLDYGGSFSVFTFGGFVGLFLGIMLNCKYKGENETGRNRHYTGNSFSVSLSLMGNLIVWALFPIFVMDPEYQSRAGSSFQLYTVPLNMIFGMAGSTVMAIGVSSMINHSLAVRDVVQAPTAGAVAIASSAYFITNPVYSLVIGSVAGIIQTVLQTFVEKRASRKSNITNTFSFIVFGVQGIIGSIFASGFREALNNETNGLEISLSNLPFPVFGFVTACISAGVGIVFGVFIGIFYIISAKHVREEHFHDFTYWVNDDGIRYDLPESEEEEDESINESSEPAGDFYIRETAKDIKMKHAYL